MMFDLDEEDLKWTARNISEAAGKIQERMMKDAMLGGAPAPYSPFVSTGALRPSLPFGPFVSVPLWTVITSPYVVEKKKRCREMKRTFWQRLWDGLTDLNPWPSSPIEFYEVNVPTLMLDKLNHKIICHPSLEREIKRAVDGEHL